MPSLVRGFTDAYDGLVAPDDRFLDEDDEGVMVRFLELADVPATVAPDFVLFFDVTCAGVSCAGGFTYWGAPSEEGGER